MSTVCLVRPGRCDPERIKRVDVSILTRMHRQSVAGMAYMRMAWNKKTVPDCACACWDQEAAWSTSDLMS